METADIESRYKIINKKDVMSLYLRSNWLVYMLVFIIVGGITSLVQTAHMQNKYTPGTMDMIDLAYVILIVIMVIIAISTFIDLVYMTMPLVKRVRGFSMLASRCAQLSLYEAYAYPNKTIILKETKNEMEIAKYKSELAELTLTHPKSAKLNRINTEIETCSRTLYNYIITDIAYVCEELDRGNIDILN